MNLDETADLIELLAAANVLNRLDPRTPDVWAAALGDLEYRDCMRAAAHLIRTQQWVKIADVRDAVAEIRSERVTAANLVYDGDPEETAEESVVSLRSLVRAAGDGHLPPRQARTMLEPGEPIPEPTGRARAILDAVGQHVPTRRDGVVNVLAVVCPVCLAQPGRPCSSPRNLKRRRPDVHPTRLEDARRIAAGQPPAAREDVEREIERRRQAAAAALASVPEGTVVEPDDDFDRRHRTRKAAAEAAKAKATAEAEEAS